MLGNFLKSENHKKVIKHHQVTSTPKNSSETCLKSLDGVLREVECSFLFCTVRTLAIIISSGIISRQYRNVTDIPLCYPTPSEVRLANQTIEPAKHEDTRLGKNTGLFAGIFIAAFVVFCLLVYAVYKLLTRRCVVQKRGFPTSR